MFSLDSSQTSGQSRNKFFFVKKFLRHLLTAANKQCCCTTIVEQTWANEKLRNKIHETNQRVTVSHCKKTLPIFQSELFYQCYVYLSLMLRCKYFKSFEAHVQLISLSIICCLLPRLSTTLSFFYSLYFTICILPAC